MKEIKIWPGFEQLRRAGILKRKENMCCRHFSIPSEPLFMAESPIPQLLVTSEADSSHTHVSLGNCPQPQGTVQPKVMFPAGSSEASDATTLHISFSQLCIPHFLTISLSSIPHNFFLLTSL